MTAGAWQTWLMIGAMSFGLLMPDDRHAARSDSSSVKTRRRTGVRTRHHVVQRTLASPKQRLPPAFVAARPITHPDLAMLTERVGEEFPLRGREDLCRGGSQRASLAGGDGAQKGAVA